MRKSKARKLIRDVGRDGRIILKFSTIKPYEEVEV